jgi:hypothetical protein
MKLKTVNFGAMLAFILAIILWLVGVIDLQIFILFLLLKLEFTLTLRD